MSITEISIIIPTYNRANLIAETLDSILNQSYKNWECIIIDDGSKDDTQQVLKPYLEDNRFRFFLRTKEYKKGPSGCRNFGLNLAKGKYIVFFDSDDIINPRALEICLNLLASSSNKFINYSKKPFKDEWDGDFLNIDKEIKTREITIDDIYDIVTQRIGFACCTIMWKKEVIETGRFNEDLTYAEEWEFYIRLMTSEINGILIDNILYHNRKHPNSNTGEFYKKNSNRLKSKVSATKLIIDNLKSKNLLSTFLQYHFVRLGFELNQPGIINYALDNSEFSWFKKKAYSLGYKFYPLLRPLFKVKGKLKNLFK